MPVVDHIIHVANGTLQSDTPATFVRDMAKRAAASPVVVLHIHGGLVKESSGRDTATRLCPVYQAAGAFPVFFVWEAGLFETLRNNLGEIAQEAFFQLLWKRVAKIVSRKTAQTDGQRAASALPLVDTSSIERAIEESLVRDSAGADRVDQLARNEPAVQLTAELSELEQAQLELDLQVDAELLLEVRSISNGMRTPADIQADEQSRGAAPVRASSHTLMDPAAIGTLVDRPDPGARGVVSVLKVAKAVVMIAARVIARMVRNRDHGLHATIVEEILREFYLANAGGAIWELMKQDTADCFKNDPDVFGGTCFLDALAQEMQAQQTSPRIVVVGHSTGAVFISHFVDAAAARLPATADIGIIFLAPASRFELTAATLAAHPNRIRAVRSFGMKDAVEQADRLVPVLYPHSLLYFVSGVVEHGDDVPLVGMARFHDTAHFPAARFPEVEQVRAFLQGQNNGTVWSTVQNAGVGINSMSEHHGDFDNDPTTLVSVQDMIRSGF